MGFGDSFTRFGNVAVVAQYHNMGKKAECSKDVHEFPTVGSESTLRIQQDSFSFIRQIGTLWGVSIPLFGYGVLLCYLG